MVKGYLARRIYLSPTEWLRNALLTVDDAEGGKVSVSPFDGVESPATTFVEGVILPFEPLYEKSVPLTDYLTKSFPQHNETYDHYWELEYPGLFSGKDTPAEESAWHVRKLC
ncbi:MAG: hypothetical protein IKX43_12180 [Paludibacteraceae bacterium]|nr:hypothetical protein [Paludibacteraceae bacterium]